MNEKLEKKESLQQYQKDYNKERDETLKRFPTVYISSQFRQELDDLVERNDTKMKDVLVTGALFIKLLEEHHDLTGLFAESQYKISREDYEANALKCLNAFIKKNGLKIAGKK